MLAMFGILVLVLVGVFADEDLTMENNIPIMQVYSLDDMHHDDHHLKPHNIPLDHVHDHKKHSKVEKIVSEFFNPDYMEPITVLDYRYMKTGGRDYTRGPGGQILILPKGVRINEKKEFENYDAMLDYLREKQLHEHMAHHVTNHGHAYHKQHIQILGGHHHDHGHDHDDHNDHHDDQNHRSHRGASMYGGYKKYAQDIIRKLDTMKEHEETDKK